MLEGLVNREIDKLVEDLRKSALKVMKQAEGKADKKLVEIMERDMLDNYYDGYAPLFYGRTFQLKNSIVQSTKTINNKNEILLDFGIDYYPYAMNHNPKQQFLGMPISKKPKNSMANEGEIFKNFLAGEHPNVGPEGTTPVEQEMKKGIDALEQELASFIENAVL